MSELSFDCQAVLDRLDAYRLGELSASETDAFCAHLAECRKCLCEEKQQQALLERLRATCRNCCPEELRRRVMQACGCKGD
ncbi:MAG: zf-HC2 domain-containing protein [Gemmatimonadota bacterium]